MEDGGETNGATTHMTLGGILSIKDTTSYRIHNRTLLDLIREDPTSGNESKKKWKVLTEKLRLQLAGSACTTAVPTVASHVHITSDRNGTNRSNSAPVNSASGAPVTLTENVRNEPPVAVEESELTSTEENLGHGGEGGGPVTVKVSLMSLLEVDGSVHFDDDDDDDDETEEAVDGGGGGGDGGGCGGGGGGKYNNCCVCMVRHKGAAFIPCGHTFCRVCSRELFVKRASCPLCNHFISEILDIF